MDSNGWVELGTGIGTILVGVATIVAIIRGPIIALRIQRTLDEEREVRNRKIEVFKTLMSARPTLMSPTFVHALNMIDLEFTDAAGFCRDKEVRVEKG
jgi:hypothetical protein